RLGYVHCEFGESVRLGVLSEFSIDCGEDPKRFGSMWPVAMRRPQNTFDFLPGMTQCQTRQTQLEDRAPHLLVPTAQCDSFLVGFLDLVELAAEAVGRGKPVECLPVARFCRYQLFQRGGIAFGCEGGLKQ